MPDFSTVARVKAFAGITTTTHDAWLTQVIPQLSAAFARHLGRWGEDGTDYTTVASHVERFDPDGVRRAFRMRGVPIVSVGSVVHGDVTYTADDYILLADLGVVEFLVPPVYDAQNRLVVTYTGGMAADPASFITKFPDLALALEMQVSALLKARDSLGAPSISVAGAAVSFSEPGSWIPAVQSILERYVLRS